MIQWIEAWYERCDTRGVAHRSLVRDWLRANPGCSDTIDNFAYGDIPLPIFEECLDWAGKVEHFVDLGCGCGKPTLLAAARGARAVGYDLLPGVVEVARRAAQELRIEAEFRVGDLVTAELDGVDLVYVAATRFDRSLVERVETKLLELAPGARVLSVTHPFLTTEAVRRRRFCWGDGELETEHDLYLGRRTAQAGEFDCSQKSPPRC